MRKLCVFSLMFILSACAEGSIYSQYDQACDDHLYAPKNCPVKKEVRKEQPKKVYVYKEEQEVRPQQRIRLVAQRPAYVIAQAEPAPVPVTTIKVQAPAPAPVPAPVVVSKDNCNGCEPIIRQTREPVEVIYKKTTYTTVFEPKTTSTVAYEREPVVDQKIISNTQVVTEPAVKTVITTQPEVKNVVTTTTVKPVVKKISYTIENTETTAPSELLIEEVK